MILVDSTRPVVFLDLCGVIADTYLTRRTGVSRVLKVSQIKQSPLFLGDVYHVPTWEALRALLDHYDVQIVVVSSWLRPNLPKDHPDVIALGEFLGTDRLLGSLCTTGGFYRGDSVKRFVEECRLQRWLVIDDAREQMYRDNEFFNNRRFVHPHGRYGIGAKELEKVDYLLGGQVEGDDFLERLFQLEGLEKW